MYNIMIVLYHNDSLVRNLFMIHILDDLPIGWSSGHIFKMHNNIMAAGSKDRPPMLAPGRYPQWRSRFLRYVDTRPNDESLKKCILSGPYKPTTVLVQAVEATDDSSIVPEHTTVETPVNMSSENKA
nr:hypothetical protein [Tanacetum cinerariifolium]